MHLADYVIAKNRRWDAMQCRPGTGQDLVRRVLRALVNAAAEMPEGSASAGEPSQPQLVKLMPFSWYCIWLLSQQKLHEQETWFCSSAEICKCAGAANEFMREYCYVAMIAQICL